MWRWDADLQRWVDDEGVTGGGDAGSETPWWAAEETRAAGVWPPPLQPPPVQPPPPPAHLPPVQQPVQQPWQQAGPGFGPAPANVPGPGYPTPIPPTGSGGSGRLIAMVVALVLAVGGIGAGVWVLMRNDGADRRTSAGSQPSLSASASAYPSDTPSPSPSASASAFASPSVSAFASVSPEVSTGPEPAPGYSRAVDPVGYTLDVPDGWLRKQEKGVKAPVVTYYTEVGDSRQIELFKVTEDSPADSLDQAENQPWGFKKKLSGYEVLDRTSGPGWAELTYHYNSGEEVGPLLVIDHRFTAPDGEFYAIRVSRYEGETAEDLGALLTTVLNSFCPTGATCTGT